MKSYLVIGAGMAGLTAATLFVENGIQVKIVDKGRGVGGRMATRRIESPKGIGVFDYGTQYMTVSDPLLQKWVNTWQKMNYITPWSAVNRPDRAHPRWIGKSGMRTIAKLLAEQLFVQTGVHIVKLEYQTNQWWAYDELGQSYHADSLFLTAPVPQVLALLQESQISIPQKDLGALRQVTYEPCFALLILMEQSSGLLSEGPLEPDQGSIRWIADNQQKGISPERIAVTIHASPEFTRHHFDKDHKWVIDHMVDAAIPYIGKIHLIDTVQLHRWRYSRVLEPFSEPFYYIDRPGPLVIAGDGFIGSRIESAFLSAKAAVEFLLS